MGVKAIEDLKLPCEAQLAHVSSIDRRTASHPNMAILVFCLMLASLAISQRVDKEIRCIRSFNFPPNTKCGVRGTLTNPKVLSDHVAKAPFESGDQLLQDCQVSSAA